MRFGKVGLSLREFLGFDKPLVIKHLKKIFKVAKQELTEEILELILKGLDELKESEKTGEVADAIIEEVIEEVEEIKAKKKKGV